MAEKLMEIAEAVGQDKAKANFDVPFSKFLADEEPEVRSAAVKRLGDFGILLEKEFLIDKVVPNLKGLLTDTFPYVR